MEIRNEEHAREMIDRWRQMSAGIQKREIGQAVQRLELSLMYYEQKDNDQGTARTRQCLILLREYLESLT
jgi:hypothetical protein